MNNKYNNELQFTSEDTINCLYFTTTESFVQDSYWAELCEQINKVIEDLSSKYLWHKDKLEVFPPILNKKSDDIPIHLYSSTCFGDNIEDEWFIVYLVFEITRKFQDLIVQLSDSDGDFLLIEAADYLPKWMNPENTENKVFIFNGEIHVVPGHIEDVDTDIKLKDAIVYVKEHSQETKASHAIQTAISKRIAGYPEKIENNIHRALVELPLDLATVLSLQPTLISPIVHAYCNHDMIDAKCCKTINLQDTITVRVSFTKCQYAMLMHSKVMRTMSHISAKNKKKFNLGLKLLCGYKIIMKDGSDIYNSKDYRNFLENLKNNSYFKENIEGSKDYVCLLEKANEYYELMLSPINKSVCNTITKLMSTKEFVDLKEKLFQNADEPLQEEDNEDWLNIEPDHLNNLLNARYGKHVNLKDEITPETITNQLSSFLYKSSDFEGIELNENDDSTNDKIEFDCEMFAEALQDMLKIISSVDAKDQDLDDFSSDFEEDKHSDKIQKDLDEEIKETLSSDIIKQNAIEKQETTYNNILQSLKEEKGFSGPSSNLLKNICIGKKDFLDSDDDSE